MNPAPPRPFASIVVSNWEGEQVLARCLSSLQLSAARCQRDIELLVVDDASTDGSAALVRERFPRARLLVNERNIGFGPSTMRGIRAARGRVVILCNNDLAASEDFVPRLLSWFQAKEAVLPSGERIPHERLFAVGARTMRWWDGEPQHVRMVAAWSGGRLNAEAEDAAGPCRCDFVQAGAAAYNRAHLLRLGGLRPLFEPGYWEDYDLSYRAVRSGLACLYDPGALALHHGGGSMARRFGEEGVHRLRARNHLLFEWSNLRPREWPAYAARLPFNVAREWAAGRTPRLTRALWEATLRLADASR